jgi:RNA polymerase sigma-70 factor (ECF subfamily)
VSQSTSHLSTTHPRGEASQRAVFVTTHWSVVLTAGGSDTSRADDALAKLCETYWYPLYAHVRRRGHSPENAKDLTQAFFVRLLRRRSFTRADPNLGRFRSYILAAMNNFLAGEWAKSQTQKRGGGCQVLSLDLGAAEERFDLEPANDSTPEKAFDREWANALLEKVLNRLANHYVSEGKAELFEALKRTLAGAREQQPYAGLAAELGMTEGAVRTAVHRMRRRYRELLRAEIADTVASTEEVDEEMRHLFKVMGGG